MADTPCPHCAVANSRIIDSRPARVDDLHTIRRRRVCKACRYRWTTHEFRDSDLELVRAGGNLLQAARNDALNLLSRLSGGGKNIR